MKQATRDKLFDRLYVLKNRERSLEVLYRDNSGYPKFTRVNKLLITTIKKLNKIKNLLHQ